MQFAAIPGLSEVKSRLVQAVNHSHMAHAQLFLGPEGSGNLSLAMALATFVNCNNQQETDSCGVCASCKKNAKFIHPDVHFIFPVSSTAKVSGKDVMSASFMKEWREFMSDNPYGSLQDWTKVYGGENKQVNISKAESKHIIQTLSLKSFEGAYKVMLIWLPEYMHPSAANGILKILEEPAERTLFLLVAHDAEKLLTTILSRTQRLQVPGFTTDDIQGELTKKFQLDEQKARHIANLSDGDLNLAFHFVTETEDDTHQLFSDWMRSCYSRDLTELVAWAERFHRGNKLWQKTFLQYGLTIVRETMVAHYGSRDLSKLPGETEFIKKFSQVIAPVKLDQIAYELNQAFYHLERNASAKILFMDLSLEVSSLIKDQ